MLVNLNGVDGHAASLACAMFMQSLWASIKRTKKDKATYVILDECAEFMNIPVDIQTMLEQSRKHKVGLVLATQQLKQLQDLGLLDSAIQNTLSKIVFTTHYKDAVVLRREMGGNVTDHHFTQLPRFQAIVQTLAASGPAAGVAPPVSVATLPPAKPTNVAAEVLRRNHELYGRFIREVEAEIEERRRADGPAIRQKRQGTRRPPKLGWE